MPLRFVPVWVLPSALVAGLVLLGVEASAQQPPPRLQIPSGVSPGAPPPGAPNAPNRRPPDAAGATPAPPAANPPGTPAGSPVGARSAPLSTLSPIPGDGALPARRNDPTAPPGAAVRELLQGGTQREQGPQAALPDVRLRARIVMRDKPAVAVIDIGGRAVTVRAGDEFTVPIEGDLVPVRVATLTATDLQLELVNRRAMVNLK